MTIAVIILLLVLFIPKLVFRIRKFDTSTKKPKKKKIKEEDKE